MSPAMESVVGIFSDMGLKIGVQKQTDETCKHEQNWNSLNITDSILRWQLLAYLGEYARKDLEDYSATNDYN